MRKLVRSRKKHICDRCGCNIRVGVDHFTELVYIPVKYDSWEDIKTGGYSERVHEHQCSAECDLAIKQVTDEFFNIQKQQ